MRETLAVTFEISVAGERGNSDIKNIAIETSEISAGYYPKHFSGRLLNLSQDKLEDIRSSPKVAVGFQSKPYRFDDLGQDGSFTIHRDWPNEDDELLLLQKRLSFCL